MSLIQDFDDAGNNINEIIPSCFVTIIDSVICWNTNNENIIAKYDCDPNKIQFRSKLKSWVVIGEDSHKKFCFS